MPFHPEEILFSPTTVCNLYCPHCNVKRVKAVLPVSAAKKFLIGCKKKGIDRVGFTGGEPFLARRFLYSVTRFAVKEGFFFTQIVTNGVWHKNDDDLRSCLERLSNCGYDGSILLSVDGYHKQDLRKVARFITVARSIWRRQDLVSIAYVTGRDSATKQKISKLAELLGARLKHFGTRYAHIKSDGIFIKIGKIDLSPIGKAVRLKDPWDGRWFKEDHCRGPGNLFFVEPSGEVKPCCGYASESRVLSLGNIKKDTVSRIVENIRQNRIVYAIFNSGLSSLRKRLGRCGVKFPGKTGNNCFFCHYILERHEKILRSLYYPGRHPG